jgi:hypothetical protein
MKHSVAVPEAILAANREGDRNLGVPNPNFTGVMDTFTGVVGFFTGMTGPITRLMTTVMTRGALRAKVIESVVRFDIGDRSRAHLNEADAPSHSGFL